jgi:hypothetical protein
MGVRAGANVISENQEANVKVRSGVVVFGTFKFSICEHFIYEKSAHDH